jgi:hypothetical protein
MDVEADGGVNPLYLAMLEAGLLQADLETISVLRVYCGRAFVSIADQTMGPLLRRQHALLAPGVTLDTYH